MGIKKGIKENIFAISIVILVFIIFLAITIPSFFSSPNYIPAPSGLKGNMHSLQTCIEDYYINYKKYPDNIEEITEFAKKTNYWYILSLRNHYYKDRTIRVKFLELKEPPSKKDQ